MTIVLNASCTTNFITPLEKVDNEEFGIPKGLMTIVYATTTTWKIIDVPVSKDKHVSCGVGQYMIASITGARKEVRKAFHSYMQSSLEIYMKCLPSMIVGQLGGSMGNGCLSSKL